MFRTLKRKILPNPFEQILRKAKKNGKTRFLLAWNRGLGDIPLGLYAMTYRIYQYIPKADITFLARKDLQEGFSFLPNTHCLVADTWKRHCPYDVEDALKKNNIDPKQFDFIVANPDPTHWVKWQLSTLVPKLTFPIKYHNLYEKFSISQNRPIIALQPGIESNYNLFRAWQPPVWQSLIEMLEKKMDATILLIGQNSESKFYAKNLLDLRGMTTLYELISILQNRCNYCILPDSGILSILYYIDCQFPIKVISTWADPKQGVLKQNVASPNKLLRHIPLIAKNKDIQTIREDQVVDALISC